ncbi:MAG: ExeA family protein [Planctomycetaceae bacterium]
MYESYWGLSRAPFDTAHAPEFYFPARSHHGALLKLRYLIENQKGCGVVVGDHGLGKTFLTYVLERELSAACGPFVRILFPLISPAELLRYVGLQTGAIAAESAAVPATDVVLTKLEHWLKSRGEAAGSPVLIVDDAHLLDPEHLQTLQFLLHLGPAGQGFTLILAGRSDLLPRIRRVPALADRVSVQTVLQPLSSDETPQYVAHRLRTAGCGGAILAPAAVHAAWELSRGFPRSLNQLCDLSLLVGFAEGLKVLSRVDIEAAAEELTSVSSD